MNALKFSSEFNGLRCSYLQKFCDLRTVTMLGANQISSITDEIKTPLKQLPEKKRRES